MPRHNKPDCGSSALTTENNETALGEATGRLTIAQFYSGRSIFITGGTGFMGKVLVEKLLRSCPSVKTIFLLLRSKRGQNPQQRLEELFGGKVFDRVREDQPGSGSKLVAVSGDITLPSLGLSESDVNLLVKNVSVVFHTAATVKFDDPLKSSVNINLLGTRRILEICHKMPLIQALVHVSTAYSNCDRNEVDEVIYSLPVTPRQIIDTVEWMDEDLLNSITPKLIGARPNTYTFTKALAENLLADESGGLPLAIVRPSVVTAAVVEPYPGWVDNMNGPTGILLALGKGLVQSIWGRSDFVSDIIPVDVAINLMLSVAWHTATERPNSIMVYNCTSGTDNPTTWGYIKDKYFEFNLLSPSAELFMYPGYCRSSTNRICHLTSMFLRHYLPAACVDLATLCIGKKPRMVNVVRKIHKALNSLEHFTTNEWKFLNQNVKYLYQQLTTEDKEIFPFDIRKVNWKEYMNRYVLGVRAYTLKEDPATIPAAKKNLAKLYLKTQIANLVIVIAIFRFLLFRSRTVRQSWMFVMNMFGLLGATLSVPTFLRN